MSEMEKQWAQQFGITEDEARKAFETKLADLKKKLPGKSEDFYVGRARVLAYRDLRGAGFSRAEPFHVVWFGGSEKRDIWANRVNTATEMYNDPKRRSIAIAKKFVTPDGTPLDTRGRKIKRPTYMRTVIGFGHPEKDVAKLVRAGFSGKQADLTPPLLVPVVALLNIRGEESTDAVWSCSSSVNTKFEPLDSPEFKDVGEAWAVKILLEAPGDLRCALADLLDWHKAHADDQRRLVIVEGDVFNIGDEPTDVGNFALDIEDETTMAAGMDPIRVWISEEMHEQVIDPEKGFGVGSRIVVVGRTAQAAGYNRETRTEDASNPRALINAFAVLCEPENRIPPEEVDVSEAEEAQ